MPGIAELARVQAGLDAAQARHLQLLVRSWALLADLSFADLLLFGRPGATAPGKMVLLGHVRPTTAQTIYRTDLVGELFDIGDRPIVRQVFSEGRSAEGEIHLIGADEPVRVFAVPVRFRGEVLAVMTRETLPPLARPPSDLERTYLEVFGRLARMIEEGTYPFARDLDDQYYNVPRVGDGVIVVDAAGRVVYNSPNAVSALHRLGVHVNAEGFTLGDLGVEDGVVRSAFATRAPVIAEAERGTVVTVVLNCIPLLEAGEVSGGLVLVRDISELRRRDRMLVSKDATIREIHHRVKNNLQTVSSLLRLQSRRLSSQEARDAVEESVRRIASIAVVHETLAHQIGDRVRFVDVVRPLVAMVSQGLSSPERPVRFEITGDAGVLSADIATPLAVVFTELIQNAVEHAFPVENGHAEPGLVTVTLGRDDSGVRARIVDNGVGVPPGFSLADDAGLGLTIVRTFVEADLGGTIDIGRRDDGVSGTEVTLCVPVPPEQRAVAGGVDG